MNIIYNFVRLN